MQKIQMVDLYRQYLGIKGEIDHALETVITSTAFIKGPDVYDFEKELAKYCVVEEVVSCGNGTDALQIAMMALGFKPGDEVIIPAFTYVATAEVIALLGLKPVFVDVDPQTFNIDPEKIKESVTSKTVAIVPVHLFGQCAEMDQILQVAKQYNLKVIEDAAQAIGSIYTFPDGKQKQAGTIGDIGITSFFPSKNLGCFGDGGALMINEANLAKKCRMIANHGQQKKYYHDIIGINSRLDTIQAAILRVKLRHLDEYNEKRQKAANFYDSHLSSLESVKIPFRTSTSTHVYHQYTLKFEGIERDMLKNYLQGQNVPSMIYYPVPLHQQTAYKHYGSSTLKLPVSESLTQQVLSLPIHTELKEEEQQYIVDKIKSFVSK